MDATGDTNPDYPWRSLLALRDGGDHHAVAGNSDFYRGAHVVFRFAVSGVSAGDVVRPLVRGIFRVAQMDAGNGHVSANWDTDHARRDAAGHHGRLRSFCVGPSCRSSDIYDADYADDRAGDFDCDRRVLCLWPYRAQ